MKPLKIFVDAHQFDHGFEGSASFIQGLYLALLRRRPGAYRIFLGCAHPDRVMANFEGNPDFEPVRYGTDNRYRRLAWDIPRAVSACGADWAHFQYFTPLIKTCPWVVTLHDVLFNDFPQYFPPGYAKIRNVLFPLSARRADILTTVSPYSRERIAHWYRIDPARITVVPNGVNAPDTRGRQAVSPTVADLIATPRRYILCVSRFEPRKNQVAVLEAFRRGEFWREGIRLVFVGNRTLAGGDFDRVFEALPAEVKGSVGFLEGLSFPDIQLLYANAAVAVYPSFAEGFGMPPLEAAAAATPSLCARTTAMRDFTFLETSFFEPSDVQALATLMRESLVRSVQAQAAVKSIQAEVLAQYSWDRAAELFEHELDLHLSAPRTRSAVRQPEGP